MGSSKKGHKERKRSKKDRRSRSPSSSSSPSDSEIYERRRKRPQKDSKEDHAEKHERAHSEEDERHKQTESTKYRDEKAVNHERRDRRETGRSERERRRSATPEYREPTPPNDKEKLSMSIDETNQLRAKLGLKPLQVDDDGDKKGSGENNEVFVRTENISDKKEAEAFREKIRSLRDQQKIKEKYGKVKTLAESDEDDDAVKWIDKSRKLQEEKAMAAAREKVLMEMESELGVGDLVNKELSHKKEYSARDLKGIEIVHKEDRIREGDTVVLTLKDHGVLDDSEDVLENVNLVDDEKAEKNVMNKKLGLDAYNPYDDADMDEFGIAHKKTVLSKYDEEIEGSKKESFKIGVNREQRKQKELEQIRVKLSKQKETLELPEPTIARDYLTGNEAAAFKKRKKKIVRKIRKPDVFKADDILPLGDEELKVDHGSRNRRVLRHDAEEDLVGPDTDLSNFKVEDDIPERYHTRIRKVKEIVKKEVVEPVAPQSVASDDDAEEEEAVKGVPFTPSMIMNSTAEFCRTLGSTSSYIGKELSEEKSKRGFEEDMEVDQEPEVVMEPDEEEEQKNLWSEVDPLAQQKQKQAHQRAAAEPIPTHLEAFPILEEEPSVAQGIAGALKLALKKGYIDDESKNNPAAVKKLQDLQAKNYQIEEKYYDEEGRGRRGGGNTHYHGPVSDFKDKANYKPEVKLDYIDDSGRLLNEKEAFRYLSHKFHGKGSGKNKIDKRQKKIEQTNKLEQMSSSDTPLNTLKLLKEKQKQLQTPYIMLSGGVANTLSGPSGLSKK